MHAETLRETWSVKTTVCRILSCRRQLFEIVWDDRRRESLRGQNSRARSFEPQADKYAGGHRIRVTPVPIPNTEVKPDTADGTAWETVWESRSLPAVIQTRTPDAHVRSIGRFCCAAADLQPHNGVTRLEAIPTSARCVSYVCSIVDLRAPVPTAGSVIAPGTRCSRGWS